MTSSWLNTAFVAGVCLSKSSIFPSYSPNTPPEIQKKKGTPLSQCLPSPNKKPCFPNYSSHLRPLQGKGVLSMPPTHCFRPCNSMFIPVAASPPPPPPPPPPTATLSYSYLPSPFTVTTPSPPCTSLPVWIYRTRSLPLESRWVCHPPLLPQMFHAPKNPSLL